MGGERAYRGCQSGFTLRRAKKVITERRAVARQRTLFGCKATRLLGREGVTPAMLGMREILQKGDTAAVAPTSPTDFPMLNQLARTAGKTASLLLAEILDLTGPSPVNASGHWVALPNGQVMRMTNNGEYHYIEPNGGSHPWSLKGIQEDVHNGQSTVHNALWDVLTFPAPNFPHADAVQIYNYALTPEGRSEITRLVNGNSGLHQKVPNALSNFNAWATANGFKSVKISSTD
jgi:hypothetical protein